MKDVVEVKELKEKYPEQTKWIAQELYKANSQEDYKNLYNSSIHQIYFSILHHF